MTPVHSARSLLFVPGHRPDRFDNAARSGADVGWQSADRGRLIDHDEHGSVLGLEFRKQFAELGFGVGQALVERFHSARGDGGLVSYSPKKLGFF